MDSIEAWLNWFEFVFWYSPSKLIDISWGAAKRRMDDRESRYLSTHSDSLSYGSKHGAVTLIETSKIVSMLPHSANTSKNKDKIRKINNIKY